MNRMRRVTRGESGRGAFGCRFAAAGLMCGLAVLMGAAPPGSRVRVLFDGKTLEGWEATKLAKPGEVKVEDGAIVLGVGQRMTGVTSTRKDLPKVDYELTYEAKRLSGRDFFAAATFPVGESFATLVNGGWGGSVTGISSLNGADASENATTTYFKYEEGPWYTFRVRVTGDAIRGWVGEKRVVDVGIRDTEVKTRIEVRGNQPLGFMSYGSSGAIREGRGEAAHARGSEGDEEGGRVTGAARGTTRISP